MAQRVQTVIVYDSGRAVVWLPELDEVAIVPLGAEPEFFASKLAAKTLLIDRADVRLAIQNQGELDKSTSDVEEISARARQGLRSGFHLQALVSEIADPVHWGVVRDLAKVHARLLNDASEGYFPHWDDLARSLREEYYAATYAWVIAFETLASKNAIAGASAEEELGESPEGRRRTKGRDTP